MQNTENKITIELNGTEISVYAGLSLGELVDSRGLERRMIAVEFNGVIVSRLDYDETQVHAGDKLEIVHMVGGG